MRNILHNVKNSSFMIFHSWIKNQKPFCTGVLFQLFNMEISCSLFVIFLKSNCCSNYANKIPISVVIFSNVPPCSFIWMYITRDLQVTKLYISPRLMKILNMGDSMNCERSKQPELCARCSRGSRGLAPWRGLQGGSAPLPKFCIWQAKYA